MAKHSIWVRLFHGIGHAETIHTIAQAEFVRTLLFPTVTAMATGTAGVLGGIPIMWVIAATAVAFMGAAQGVLSASTYLERKNPAYKLQVLKTLFNYDLVAIAAPNRKQRKSAAAQGGAPAIPAFRHLVKGQLGIEIWNRASFPISIIVSAAETEVEGLKPPRATFPKKPVIIQPGTTMWVHDDPIEFDNMLCDNLDGKMDLTVKYGLPGKENFEIKYRGAVEVFMESYGLLKGIYFHPESDSRTPTN
jgi:hypothetical protein